MTTIHNDFLVYVRDVQQGDVFLQDMMRQKDERKDLHFHCDENEVSPVTGVGRALKSRKLSPKFIGLFEVLNRISPATYRIALLLNLSNLHPVFHMSQLRQYVPDPPHVIDPDPVQVRKDLLYDLYPVRISDHRVKQLRGKEISLVKVIRSSSVERDATWETESRMRELYPGLFL
ncbi:uncharacterized protein LOC113866587 [Abrus precatorius]|uniref:Uncharacterized protein LOC113866587 n=1 Tax=Abrus precatorius TaxID=3816 RepID=A0A8B8LQQ2_ABRPR|nr:uncharacterized protein LOC113866587 [Abrus precatorius]